MSVNQDTACVACRLAFSEINAPRLLACGHSFCATCLSRPSLKCPVDGWAKGPAELNDLPINYAVLQALAASAPPPAPDCEVCDPNESPQHAATKRCIECGEDMCDTAAAFHARSKASRDHRQLSIAELAVNPQLAAARLSTFCEVHHTEPFKFWDRDCQRLLCRDCLTLNHKHHACVAINVVAEQSRKELQTLCAQTTRRVAEMSVSEQKVSMVTAALKAKYDLEAGRIRSEFDHLRNALTNREADLLSQLADKHETKRLQLEVQNTILQTFADCSRTTVARSNVSASAPSDTQFLLTNPALANTLAALIKTELPLQPITDAALEFFVSRSDAIQSINAIGVVVDKATAAALCTAQGSALDLARAGAVSRFEITARDPQGAPRGIGGDSFVAELRHQHDAKKTVAVAVEDRRDGTYICAYRLPADASGRWVLTVRLHDTPIVGSPFVIDIDTANLQWDKTFVSDHTGTADEHFAFSNNDLSARKTGEIVKIQTIRSSAPLPPPGVVCKWRVRVDSIPDRNGTLDIGFGRNCGQKNPWLRGCEIFGDFCVSEPQIRVGDMIEISFDAAIGKAVFRRLHPDHSAPDTLKEVVFERGNQHQWYALASMSVGCAVSFH